MISYRITKYDPKKRDSNGAYIDNSEWTSIYDFKNLQDEKTFEDYLKIENCYVYAVRIILQEKKITNLKVESLENYSSRDDFKKLIDEGLLNSISFDYDQDIKILENDVILNQTQIEKTIRLILRETIWMLLVDRTFEIKFGYDYCMYIKCDSLTFETIRQIEELGLFVEPNVDQKTITI